MRYHDDRLAGRLIDLPEQAHNLRSGLATYVFCETYLRGKSQNDQLRRGQWPHAAGCRTVRGAYAYDVLTN